MQIAIIDGHDLTEQALLSPVAITTWGEFNKENDGVFSSDEYVDALMSLNEGKEVKIGGGATPEYTLIKEGSRFIYLVAARALEMEQMIDRLATAVEEWMVGAADQQDAELVAEARALLARMRESLEAKVNANLEQLARRDAVALHHGVLANLCLGRKG